MATGRRRAAERLTSDTYVPHPGWRHLLAIGWRVIVDQAEALHLVADLVDEEEWRSDKRAAWSAILRQLVNCMDWETGLVSAVTAARLGAAGKRGERTVSRVIAWARDVGLLVIVEHGASAEFLGTDYGRTPTYALVTKRPILAPPPAEDETDPDDSSPQLKMAVDTLDDPPMSYVSSKPLRGARLEHRGPARAPWPLYGVPQTPPERADAAVCVLRGLGIENGKFPGVPQFRLHALLRQWWATGACPAAVLHAIDHHPDRPDHHRGDMLRGVRDPIAILGARLRPWAGRLGELPASLVGHPGNYVAARYARQRSHSPTAEQPAVLVPPALDPSDRRSAAQAAALASFAAHQARTRQGSAQLSTQS